MTFFQKFGFRSPGGEKPTSIDTREDVPPPGLLAKLRKVPVKDDQQDFFVPVLYDVPLKDQVHLMDVAPYRLSSKSQATHLEYNVKDATITIAAAGKHGLATIKDYDLVIHMISHLNDQTQKWRKGLAPKPSHTYHPNAHDILKFCRRGKGGRQSKILEDAYGRLSHSIISIVRDDGTDRLAAGGFRMIEGFVVLSKSISGKVQDLEIRIPQWIYNGVVEKEKPAILTLHKDYFLLDLPLDRSLYRLARKTAGYSKSSYMMADVHNRSGSTRDLKQFAYDLRQLVGEGRRILDYDFIIVKGDNGERLDMRYIGKEREALTRGRVAPLKTATYDHARKFANGLDIYAAESTWREWMAEKNMPAPDKPDGAFLNWFKQYAANRR